MNPLCSSHYIPSVLLLSLPINTLPYYIHQQEQPYTYRVYTFAPFSFYLNRSHYSCSMPIYRRPSCNSLTDHNNPHQSIHYYTSTPTLSISTVHSASPDVFQFFICANPFFICNLSTSPLIRSHKIHLSSVPSHQYNDLSPS